MKLVYALILAFNVALCFGAPTEQYDWKTDPEFTGGHFEGDIILDVTRNGINIPTRYWDDGIIYYKLDSIFNAGQQAAIRTAMDTIEASTCVRYVEVTSSEQLEYVLITGDNTGCSAQVGNLIRVQNMNLQLNGCFAMGKIIHELMHVAGFFHMHSDRNRDDYVQILTVNMQPGTENNFLTRNTKDFGVEYDYASMLHYPPTAFSVNGLPTIIPLQTLPPGIVMGQRDAMTPSDILKINRAYNCFEVTTTTESTATTSEATTTGSIATTSEATTTEITATTSDEEKSQL